MTMSEGEGMAGYGFSDYERDAARTAQYPEGALYSWDGNSQSQELPLRAELVYTALGLAGEAGEYVDKIKKTLRGDSLEGLDKEALVAELGDVLWYVTRCAAELGFTLQDVAVQNVRKLDSRQSRGVIKGSGDNR